MVRPLKYQHPSPVELEAKRVHKLWVDAIVYLTLGFILGLPAGFLFAKHFN